MQECLGVVVCPPVTLRVIFPVPSGHACMHRRRVRTTNNSVAGTCCTRSQRRCSGLVSPICGALFEIPSRPPDIAGHVGSSCRLRRFRSFDCVVRCGTARLDPGAIPLVMRIPFFFWSFERDPEPNSRLTEPDNGSREGRENQDSSSEIIQSAIVACCADESRMVRDTNSGPGTATRNPTTDYKNARKQENEHVRSIMPMHPLSFGSVKEQTLDFRLSPIPRLTADFRTRRFPDLVVHQFDRSPWRWRTIFGLTN
jgi:hypothetical protein